MARHAILGASTAHRWLACPGSVHLISTLPGDRNEGSVYAREGTAAHTLAAWCLGEDRDAVERLGDKIDEFEVTDEMADGVQMYVDLVRANVGYDAAVYIEQTVSLDKLKPPHEMFGTADAVIYRPGLRKLIVVDFKYGAGVVVEAVGNPQLRYYGLGAALTNSAHKFKTLELIICQPRAYHPDGRIRSETIGVDELIEWAPDLIDGARATDDPAAPLHAGSHCQFCPALAGCPEVKRHALVTARLDFAEEPPVPASLDPAEIATILDRAEIISDWLNAVRHYAHVEAESGRPIPGYKLVAKRGTRLWRDEAKTIATLRGRLKLVDDEVYTAKLRSPAQIEKLIGKGQAWAIEDLWQQVSSGTNLVRADTTLREALPPSAVRDFMEE